MALPPRQALAARVTWLALFSALSAFKHVTPLDRATGMRFALLPASHFFDGASRNMPLNLDAYLGVHATALKVGGQRMELLAKNLANADTPGYKAQDIDFKAALARSGKAAEMPAQLKYRVPLAPALDGNTVDTQLEQAAFAENAVRFQATLSFLSARFRGLMTAITGQ
jgi:flagellar basal-body rod protein FlgB